MHFFLVKVGFRMPTAKNWFQILNLHPKNHAFQKWSKKNYKVKNIPNWFFSSPWKKFESAPPPWQIPEYAPVLDRLKIQSENGIGHAMLPQFLEI